MAIYICLNCNKEYTSRKKNSKFCSIDCKYDYNQIKYKCDYCGKEFTIYRNKYEKLLSGERKGIYCSKECSDKAHTHKVTKICKCCGKEYQICRAFKDIQQFCSKDCMNQYKRQNSIIKTVKCEYCGKEFTTYHPEQKYCSYECSGKRKEIVYYVRVKIVVSSLKELNQRLIKISDTIVLLIVNCKTLDGINMI